MPMNLRHAAALALVGWYLMVPPHLHWHGQYETYSPDAPLSEWKHKATFDTEVDCKRAITKGCGNVNQNGEVIGHVGPLCYAQCISSDDPRLKEK